MDPIDRRLMLGAAGLAGVAALSRFASAGPLDPPLGPVASTGRTLDMLYDRIARTDVGMAEPRIPIRSLPGSGSAKHVIDQPGSYYLTENVLGETIKNGIDVLADDVTIDLCGFALLGAPLTLSAINVNGRSLCVHNGVIRGWGAGAITGLSVENAFISGLRVSECTFFKGSAAVQLGRHGVAVDCTFFRNLRTALRFTQEGVAIRCSSCENPLGFDLRHRSRAVDCRATGDTLGMYFETTGLLEGCSTDGCSTGFAGFSDGMLNRCAAVGGSIGYDFSGPRNQAFNCIAKGCGEAGFRCNSTGGFFAQNSAAACLQPFDFAPGNAWGPIVVVAGMGDIASELSSHHPWANFVY